MTTIAHLCAVPVIAFLWSVASEHNGIMSRRSAPDSPWQNGMPPFGLCQQQFNPMMNCGPMWAQPSLPFMGGSMAPGSMMRFGGNVSSRSNFRRNYDQPDRYRPRQGYGELYGNRQGTFGRGDRKRPPPGDRSRSPVAKRAAPRRDGGRKAEQDRMKQQENDEQATAQEEETTGTQDDELYDPAEPTQEDADGAGKSEGTEDESAKATEETCVVDGEGQGGADGGDAVPMDESGDTERNDAAEDKEGLGKTGSKPASKPAKPAGSATKASEPKSPNRGQPAGKSADKKDGSARQDQGSKKSGTKGKGWCTVCEVHFDGSFLDHRRNEDHKVKRDEKYPKCHPCSMGFNNRMQYEQHCAGDFHRKNVEVLDNEVDETAGPLGEEYLEEVSAYFCTLCKLLLKAELKSHHCCTQGHYRRHRDIKRKEEAAAKAKSGKEKQTEEEEEDVSQMAFTVTDEIFSDEESKAATDAAADAAKEPKQDKPAEGSHEVEPQKEGPPDTVKEEPPVVEEQEELKAEVKLEPLEDEHSAEDGAALEGKQGAESDAGTAVASGEVELKVGNVPDTNGCKNLEEEVEEQQQPVVANSGPAAASKAAVPKLPKVPPKSAPTPKAAAMTPKPAGAATKAPAPKTGTAVSSSAATSAPAVPTTTATAPVKKPPAVAGSQGPAAAAGGRGGMVRGRGRGMPKAVRARKR
ncbi:hypothetical protein V5799_027291 [Amblyomma americanum]|uniref:CIZ1 C2H2-type zinc finger domain-containing protein n=1 Tax=Amblyomma americanum TaxID=6943 RepID=A0AAQ4DG57_AMBAM